MKVTPQIIKNFKRKIWEFYKQNKRMFPWRDTTDPYEILVSEMMLQQTQTTRVIPKYLEFISKFPTVKSLSRASNEDVLRAWSGLGYNRRALYLKRAAEKLTQNPDYSFENLQSHKGIGPNTAGAIFVFSQNKPCVFIETNIRRVFIHEFFKTQEKVADSEILPLIKATLEKESRDWYYALMDYGANLSKTVSNPNKKSIHHASQSKFEGSLRQVRGDIIKSLIQSTTISVLLLEQKINSPHFKDALSQLEIEKFIQIKNGNVSFV